MYKIDKQNDGSFDLTKDGQRIGKFATQEDAEKAQSINETRTWVKDGEGLEYPKGTDNYHSGEEKLSGEKRIDALCLFLRDKHGIHVPYEIAPKG